MAVSSPRKSANRKTGDGQASLGDLVAVAVSDVSALVKYELDLAKMELKADVRRLGIGAALLGVAAFVGCLMLVLLCFAYAYGLMAAGIWGWAAFLIVAGTCVVLAAAAVAIGYFKFRGLNGLRRTRRTVSDDLALIRREDTGPSGTGPSGTGSTASPVNRSETAKVR